MSYPPPERPGIFNDSDTAVKKVVTWLVLGVAVAFVGTVTVVTCMWIVRSVL